MNTLQLVKHHGFGNDFLVAFHVAGTDEVHAALARRVCDRRRGVGADGLLLGESDPDVDAVMTLYNADGSRAEMSGNGIRCFAHALARRAGWDVPCSVKIRTDAGVRRVDLAPGDDADSLFGTVDVGRVTTLPEPPGWAAIGADAKRPVAHLSVGNPHTVVAVDDVAAVDLAALGAQLPDVNLEIVAAGPGPHAITMRVHERGAGVTEACGTGACAAAVAARTWGLATPQDGKLVVHMDGGSASVGFAPGGNESEPAVSLSGPTAYVATIEIETDD